MERQKRFGRVECSGTFAQTAKFKFWQTFRGKPFCLDWGRNSLSGTWSRRSGKLEMMVSVCSEGSLLISMS